MHSGASRFAAKRKSRTTARSAAAAAGEEAVEAVGGVDAAAFASVMLGWQASEEASAADGKAVSRGDVGFDATAVFARRGGEGGGWTLALADRGEVRLYEQTWG